MEKSLTLTKKVLFFFVTLFLIAGLVPAMTFAEENTQTTSNGSVTYNAVRSGSTISLAITPTKDGTCYYLVEDADQTAPSDDAVLNGTKVSCSANVSTTTTINGLSNSAKKIYLRYGDTDNGVWDGTSVISIDAASSVSYSAELESYSSDFGTEPEGYTTAPAAKTLTITNTGNAALSFSVTSGADNYTVDTTGVQNIAAGESGTLTIQPKTGLSAGTYDSTIVLSAQNAAGEDLDLSLSADVEFSVTDEGTEPSSANSTVSYGAKWTDENTIQLTATPTNAGTAYYIVQNDTDTAPSQDEVLASSDTITCTAGSTGTANITTTDSDAKNIYIVYQNSDGTTFDMTTMSLASYEDSKTEVEGDSTTAGTVSIDAVRTSNSSIDLGITPSIDGTAYYIVTNADAEAPSTAEIYSNGTQLSGTADTRTETTITGLSSSAKKIYIGYISEDGLAIGETTVLDVPVYDSGTYEAEIDRTGIYLGDIATGYTPSIYAKTATVTNTGGETLSFSVTDTSTDFDTYFTVDASSLQNLAAGQSADITVEPVEGLDVGTYKGTFYLTADLGDNQTLSLGPITVQMRVAEKGDTSADDVRVPDDDEYVYEPSLYYIDDFPNTTEIRINDKVAYCVNYYYYLSSGDYMNLLYNNQFALISDVTNKELDAYTGLNPDADPVYYPVNNNQGLTPVKEGSEDSTVRDDIARVLYYGYPNDAAGLRSTGNTSDELIRKTYKPDQNYVYLLDLKNRKDFAFEVATQCAIWHYTDGIDCSDIGSASNNDSRVQHIKDIYTVLPEKGWDDVQNLYNFLIDNNDAELEQRTVAGRGVFRNGVEFTDTLEDAPSDFTVDLYVADNPVNNVWTQNLATYSTTSTETDDSTTNVSITKTWVNDDSSVRPTPSEFADWIQLSADGTDVTSSYTPIITDNGDGTYTVLYAYLPKTNDDDDDITYEITETIPSDSNYTQTTDSDGNITNTYTGELDTGVSVTVQKAWDDNGNADQTRPSASEFVNWIHLYANGTEVTAYKPTVTDNGDNTYTITYTDLPELTSGAYTVKEEIPTDANYTTDDAEAEDGETITNTEMGSAALELTATKKLTGETLTDGQFSFTLTGDNDVNQIQTNDADGTVTFDELTFTKAGTYNYIIKEVQGSEEGMTYDSSVYNVTVTVADTNNDGTLEATATYTKDGSSADSVVFTNTKTYNEGEADITAAKTLSGFSSSRTLKDGEFSFVLKDSTGVPIQTVQNEADGSVTFDTLQYAAAGTYTYTISEAAGSDDAVVYDSTVYNVTVKVANTDSNNDGKMDTTVTYEDGSAPTFTNTLNDTTTSITVTKEWDDDGNTGARPSAENFKDWVSVYCSGSEVTGATESVTDNGNGTYTITYSNLPKYNDYGQENTYIVVESIPDDANYTTTDADAENGKTITNTYSENKTQITIYKQWKDGNNDDGLRPDTDAFKSWLTLYADGTAVTDSKEYTLSVKDLSDNFYSITYSNLDKYQSDGTTEITYTVGESLPSNSGYTSGTEDAVANGETIVNSHEVTIDIPVTKEWAEGVSGESATVVLNQNGEQYGDEITLNEDNGWTYTFSDLPKYDSDGNAYYYTVEETNDNYNAVVSGDAESGFTITNYQSDETVDIPVTKKWADGVSGESATVVLKQNNTQYGDEITLNEDNDWTYTFSDLPKYDSSGNAYTYTVEETNDNYNAVVSGDAENGFTITNYQSDETIDIPVTKEWADGVSGESATVILEQNGEQYGDEVTLSEDNDWTYTFSDLPKYDSSGNAYVYSVAETNSNYRAEISGDAVNGFTITNYRSDQTTSVSVTKEWADGVSGESATVVLNQNDEQYGYEVTLNEDNDWTYTFSDLPKYDSEGNAYTYTVEETNDNYNAVVSGDAESGFTITNYQSDETVDIPVTKEWADGATGEKAIVVLTQNGEDTDHRVSLREDNNWTYTFEDLPKYDSSGNLIEYSVREESDNYSYTVSDDGNGGFVITNSPSTETTSVSFTKVWNDEGYSNRPSAETFAGLIHLFNDSEELTDYTPTVTDNGDNTYTITYTGLPKYRDDGTAVNYYLTEDDLSGDEYIGTNEAGEEVRYYPMNGKEVSAGQELINSRETVNTYGELEVSVTKVWQDNDDQAGFRPENIQVQLYANGEPSGDPVTLNKTNAPDDNTWVYTWETLPQYKDGSEIVYTVAEVDSVEGYTASVSGDMTNGFTITNTYTDSTVDIPVSKEWADGEKGEKADIVLKNGDETVDTVTLNEDNNWQYTFEDLPKYDDDGNEINYTVEEENVDYYYNVVKNSDGSFTVTNYATKIDIPVEKRWADGASGEKAVIVVKNGDEIVDTVELNESNGWKHVFTDLPKYDDNGNVINYTVDEETDSYRYEITSDGNGGWIITNYPLTEQTAGNVKTGVKTPMETLPYALGCLAAIGIIALISRRSAKKEVK